MAGGLAERGLPMASPDWLTRQRDLILTSPDFRRWAASFPLTRWIARRRARALFDLCAGFVYSQVLDACVRLDLMAQLAQRPRTLAALSIELDMTPEAALVLLQAAVALRLVERRRGGRFGLGALGAALVDNPGLVAMIRHHKLLYTDLQDPVALLRGARPETELSRYWAYATADRPADLAASAVADYSELMAVSQPLVAAEVLGAYPLHRHHCLLDVGGGEGAFLIEVAAKIPKLRLVLFDLPAVAERAKARFAAGGLASRTEVVGGSFLNDELPKGADVISLVRVLHDHDDASVLTLLNSVRRALPRDGTLLIAEPMSNTRGAEPVGDAYFGFYLLAMRRGQPRSPEALMALLTTAGFGRFQLVSTNTPLVTRLLLAQPELTP